MLMNEVTRKIDTGREDKPKRDSTGSKICDQYLETTDIIRGAISRIEGKLENFLGAIPKEDMAKSPIPPSPVIAIETELNQIKFRIIAILERLEKEL